MALRDINQAGLGSAFNPGAVTTGDCQQFSYQQASRPYFTQYSNFGVIDKI